MAAGRVAVVSPARSGASAADRRTGRIVAAPFPAAAGKSRDAALQAERDGQRDHAGGHSAGEGERP